MKNIDTFLKSCCKDADAYKRMKGLTEALIEEKNRSKRSLKLLECAIRSDYDSILITTLDLEKPGPKIVYVNDGFTRITGYSREEVIGKTPRILQGPKTDGAVLEHLRQRLSVGKSFFGHTVNYRKDGSEFINQWDIHPLTDSAGNITHWVSYQHDITERKRCEQKVIDSSVEFDNLTEESKKILVDIGPEGNIVASNDAFRNLIGYDAEELKQSKIWDFLADCDSEIFREKFYENRPSDFEKSSFELKFKRKNGSEIETGIYVKLLRTGDKTILRAACENKTLQKKIMFMLSRKVAHLDRALEKSRDFRYKLLSGEKGEFLFHYVSDGFEKMTGFSAGPDTPLNLKDIVHPDDYADAVLHLNGVLEGRSVTEFYRIRKKRGGYIKVINCAKPVREENGEVIQKIKGVISTEISSAEKNTGL